MIEFSVRGARSTSPVLQLRRRAGTARPVSRRGTVPSYDRRTDTAAVCVGSPEADSDPSDAVLRLHQKQTTRHEKKR